MNMPRHGIANLQIGNINQMMMQNMNMYPNQMTPNTSMHQFPMFNPMQMPGVVNMANNQMVNQNSLMGKPAIVEYKKVWVGNIPPQVSDTFMLKLLEACGSVSTWKRATDQSGRPQKFGICEYHTVESMLKSLRLLNHLKLEEGSELSIKVGSETEEFLKQWREKKKQEWVDSLKRKGIDVNMDEIKKRENNGEPLEWELLLVNKDYETRKVIFEILTQKNEIELYAKQNERPEEFLKDLKDLAHGTLSQYFESQRERERQRSKQDKIKHLEKFYKDEERKWEKREEEKERELLKEKHFEEDLQKRKEKIIERDLNYDSDEEKRKISQNSKKFEEFKEMRLKEREFDEMMRKKENPIWGIYEENKEEATDIAPLCNEISLIPKEPEAKTMIVYQEYHEEEADGINDMNNVPKEVLSLNIERKKTNLQKVQHFEEDEDTSDPYMKKTKEAPLIEINPETEREIMEMSKEIRIIPEEREKESTSAHKNIPKQLSVDNLSQLKEFHKTIIDAIPKEKDSLLKFPINWKIVEDNNIKNNKIKPWLAKKLKDYFGEHIESFNKLILDKIGVSNPYEILDTLQKVLENDAEVKYIV